MDLKIIVDKVLEMNITQEALGHYLGVTRQTVAKIKSGTYRPLNSIARDRLKCLENRSRDEILEILTIDSQLDEIKEMIIKRDSAYIPAASEGISYMHYWLLDEKFKEDLKYHKYYYAHMNNFYPRYNQASLFMRDTLNRQVYPLLTIQIDYSANRITDACLKAFKNDFRHVEYDMSDVEFPMKFQDFYDLLVKRLKPMPRFLIYKDYLDDDWKYFVEKLGIEDFAKEIYDLSRLLNFFDNDQPYCGPLLEDALEQFKIKFDFNKLLTNCHYRADKIVELMNMISLQGLAEKKHDKSSLLFDSHGLKRDITFQNKERRKQKMNNIAKEKKK